MRLTITITLAAGAIALFLCWALDVGEGCGTSLIPPIHARTALLDRMRQDRDEFGRRLEGTVADLAAGQLSLRQAAGILEAYAAEHYPVLFQYLDALSKERSYRLRIATMLLRHCDEDFAGAERWAQLMGEYEAWVAAE